MIDTDEAQDPREPWDMPSAALCSLWDMCPTASPADDLKVHTYLRTRIEETERIFYELPLLLHLINLLSPEGS